MKRYNSFHSLKEHPDNNLIRNQIKPALEFEFKKFINLLKSSIINEKKVNKDLK